MAVKVFWKFNAKAGTKTADLFIYDIIGDSWDGTTAKSFAQDLAAIGAVDTLNIFINSPGGSVWDGFAIFNQLLRFKAVKNVFVDGIAASIASVVAMAGDKIVTAPNASWMIHNPMASVFGADEQELLKLAARLREIRYGIKLAYVERSNGKATDKQFSEWMDAETWFTPTEALAAGLTDEISDKAVEAAALSKFDFKAFNYRNIPEVFKGVAAAAEPVAAATVAGSRLAGPNAMRLARAGATAAGLRIGR